MQRVARNAQQFAYRYLHTRAKALYVRQALLRYNRLFKVGGERRGREEGVKDVKDISMCF
jgi:hypothetical protein